MSTNDRARGPLLVSAVRRARGVLGLLVLISFTHHAQLYAQSPTDPPWQEIAGILQTQPVDAGGYIRYNLPRADLRVSVGDVTVTPSLALTAWAGFAGRPDEAVAMGDLVVTADELKPVLAELARQRIDVTAVHNHLIGERPQIIYLHFHATGKAADVAHRLDAAVHLTATPRPVTKAAPVPITIDSAAVFKALGKHGKANGALAQTSFMLIPGTVTMHGQPVVPALGYASPINVQQVSPNRAVATGDFAVTASQLQPLLRALAEHSIMATAVHSHMVGEQPSVYFVHFWGDARLLDLLRGLRAGIDATQ